MKKLLLTLIVSLAFGGTIFAQTYPNNVHELEPKYELTDLVPYGDYDIFNAFIQIDGNWVTGDDEYDYIEVAAFVGDECRWSDFMIFEPDWDPYPMIDLMIKRPSEGTTWVGTPVTFKMFNHATQTEYTVYECNYEIALGQDHDEIYSGLYDPENPFLDWNGGTEEAAVVLSFASPAGITKLINKDEWYLLASPVGDVDIANVTNMLENTYDIYYFNQAGVEQENGKFYEWMNYKPEGANDNPEFEPQFTQLIAGQGYLYANSWEGEPATITLTFPGTAYEGENVTVDLEYSEANPEETMRGWNLVGNPFNAQASLSVPYYRMVEGALMTETETSAIQPMEGVFVKAAGEGENVTFAPFSAKKRPMLALNLTESGRLVDRAIVGFSQGRTLPKFQLNPNSTKVYVTLDNEDYAVVRSEGMGELPVSFKAEANGNYNLSVSSEDVDFSYLHLIDNMTGVNVDLLATPSYSFDARTTDYASRFRLVFATGSSADGDSFGFVNASGNLCIFGIEGEATLQVMDVTGRILSTETFSGSYEKQLNAAPGVYMLRLTNGNNVKVQKMVVR